MDRISTFNATADLAALQTALSQTELPPQLREPLQAMVSKITAAASARPVSIYVASVDDASALRNYFAYLLARTLTRQIPSTLVVDCNFLGVGMSGLVPERDALGFLDLLLYGSSLGVITQETKGGVKMIGAGSFPVTKRMPFVSSAFDEAAHRLVQHARCVVFVGPLTEDAGDLHPLLGAVDLPVLVRDLDAVRPGAVDPIEEQIASQWDAELLSVRLIATASSSVGQSFAELVGDGDDEDAAAGPALERPVVVEEPSPRPPVAPPPVDDRPAQRPAEPRPVTPRPDRVRPAPPKDAEPGPHKAPRPPRRRSLGVVAVVIVAAAIGAWWGTRDRYRGRQEAGSPEVVPRATPPAAVPVDSTATEVAREDTSAESSASPALPGPEVEGGGELRRAVMTDTGGRTGGTVLINPEDIHVIEELKANWPDHYFIHISSFRKSVEARSEVTFLENHEFPVFIVFLDLGAKGTWYRVYAGPFKDREEAIEVKKSLDDLSSVRFTRITKIEE